MKMNLTSLVIFLIFLNFFSVECEKTFKPKPKTVFQGFYYIQKLYAGKDFLESLKTVNQMKLAYFTLNKKILFYNESFQKKDQIEGKK